MGSQAWGGAGEGRGKPWSWVCSLCGDRQCVPICILVCGLEA